VTTALMSFVFAAAFLGIGRWGRRNAADLVPATFSSSTRQRKERSLRRGAWSVTVLGGLFVLLGVLAAFGAVYGELGGTTQ
jgi:hypothetical protein